MAPPVVIERSFARLLAVEANVGRYRERYEDREDLAGARLLIDALGLAIAETQHGSYGNGETPVLSPTAEQPVCFTTWCAASNFRSAAAWRRSSMNTVVSSIPWRSHTYAWHAPLNLTLRSSSDPLRRRATR